MRNDMTLMFRPEGWAAVCEGAILLTKISWIALRHLVWFMFNVMISPFGVIMMLIILAVLRK